LFLILTTEPFSVTLGDTFERVTPQSPLLWDHVTEMFQSKKRLTPMQNALCPGQFACCWRRKASNIGESVLAYIALRVIKQSTIEIIMKNNSRETN